MKRTLIILLLVIFINSCKTSSFFYSGNNFVNETCRIFLADNTTVEGRLTVQFETGHDVSKFVRLITTANKEKKIAVTDILYFIHNNNYFFPKQINLEAHETPLLNSNYIPNVSNLLFLKRLTSATDKMHLFELMRPRGYDGNMNAQYDYFISLQNENRFVAWSIRGSKFFPDFEKRTSDMVTDCASLAAKINAGDRGYTVKQLSLDSRKYEVFKKIVDEYNSCK